jgi:hypothetical protein
MLGSIWHGQRNRCPQEISEPKTAPNFLFRRAPAVPHSVFAANVKRKAPEIEVRFQGLAGFGSEI